MRIFLLDADVICQTKYAGNDRIMLWNKGKGCLSTFELESEKIEDFKDFWQETHSKKQLKPDMVIANQLASKILAYAQDEEELMEYGFLIFQEGPKKTVVDTNRFRHVIDSWECMESSLDGRVFFVGGDNEDIGVIGSISFDSTLAIETFIKVGEGVQTSETITQIHRIIGSDHLLVAGKGYIYVYNYQDKNFKFLKIFDIEEAGLIVSIVLRKHNIFLLDDQGKVFVRNCSKELDIAALTARGRPI